jgi:hypothetical protein
VLKNYLNQLTFRNEQRPTRSNTISLYIEESEAETEQEASWMNYLSEGTHDRVVFLPSAPGSTEKNIQAATIGWLIKNMVVSLDGKSGKSLTEVHF